MFKIENAEKTEYKAAIPENLFTAIDVVKQSLADLIYEMEREKCTDVKCIAFTGFDYRSQQHYTQYCHYSVDDLETLKEDLHNLQRIVSMVKW